MCFRCGELSLEVNEHRIEVQVTIEDMFHLNKVCDRLLQIQVESMRLFFKLYKLL